MVKTRAFFISGKYWTWSFIQIKIKQKCTLWMAKQWIIIDTGKKGQRSFYGKFCSQSWTFQHVFYAALFSTTTLAVKQHFRHALWIHREFEGRQGQSKNTGPVFLKQLGPITLAAAQTRTTTRPPSVKMTRENNARTISVKGGQRQQMNAYLTVTLLLCVLKHGIWSSLWGIRTFYDHPCSCQALP